jgi:hypothetical protein
MSSNGNMNRAFSQYIKRKSAPVEWSTNIKSGDVINCFTLGDEKINPMTIMCGELFAHFPQTHSNNSNDNSPVEDKTKYNFVQNLFNKQLYAEYLCAVASVKGFSTARYLSEFQLWDYTHKVIKALQIYYSIDAVLTVAENPDLCNQGIDHLRTRLSPGILMEFAKLERELCKQVIHPSLVQYIRFMYQNFSFSDVIDSPIIRLSWDKLFYESDDGSIVDNSLESGIISSTADSLFDDTDTLAIMRACFPNYVIGDPPPSFNCVLVSQQFNTFWNNSPIAYNQWDMKGMTDKYKFTNTVTSVEDVIDYYSLVDEVDGSIYALTSYQINDKFEPGIWVPTRRGIGQSKDSHLSILRFCNGKFAANMPTSLASAVGIRKIPVMTNPTNGESSLEVRTYPIVGGRKLLTSSVLATQACCYETIQKILSVDELPGFQVNIPEDLPSKRKSRKKRSKSKGKDKSVEETE